MTSVVFRISVWGIWLLLTGLGIGCSVLFVQGVFWLDHSISDATIELPLDRQTDWQTGEFRVLGQDRFSLLLETLHHGPVGKRPYRGRVACRVISPDGRTVYETVTDHPDIGHTLAQGFQSTHLAGLELSGVPWRRWRLEARVVEPDKYFAHPAHSRVRVYRARRQLGMGGLVYYILIFPGLGGLILALVPASQMSRRGLARWPLKLNAACLILVVLGVGLLSAG